MAAVPPTRLRSTGRGTDVPANTALIHPVRASATMTATNVASTRPEPQGASTTSSGTRPPSVNAISEASAACHGFVRWGVAVSSGWAAACARAAIISASR